MIGDAGTLLPEGMHVRSCWAEPPEGFDALVARTSQRQPWPSEAEFRREWLCPEGTDPEMTGTPLPLDAPRPEGHPLDAPRPPGRSQDYD